uniref:Uncharacterized protein n=1 Tax=Salix viminalis TaxID=40686 RepID=A0A6N2M9D4_SALVM
MLVVWLSHTGCSLEQFNSLLILGEALKLQSNFEFAKLLNGDFHENSCEYFIWLISQIMNESRGYLFEDSSSGIMMEDGNKYIGGMFCKNFRLQREGTKEW